jgi:hypothetical protein
MSRPAVHAAHERTALSSDDREQLRPSWRPTAAMLKASIS